MRLHPLLARKFLLTAEELAQFDPVRALILEGAGDRATQANAARRIAEAWDCECQVRAAGLNHHDFHLRERGRLFGLGEYKRRHCERGQYPTLIISAQKLKLLVADAADQSAKPYLFIEWNRGALCYVRADRLEGTFVRDGGRPKRPGAPNDREPVTHIPVGQFRPV